MKLLVFLVLMFSLFSASMGQMTVEIDFSGNSKGQKRETKRMLRKYDIYLVLPNEDIKCEYYNDSLLNIENITEKQINRIDSMGFVVAKFINKRSCLYFMFLDDFLEDKKLESVLIYRSAKTIDVFGLFRIQIRNNGLVGHITHSAGGERPTYIVSMIRCTEYEGQFDNGMQEYLEWRRKRYLEWQKSQEK
tara:strand:- start:3860 stop:4432 length:573 start_codon:yes stop_codon:yes gene_type:complete